MGDLKKISQQVESIRREYAREELSEKEAEEHPIDQFSIWFQQALHAEVRDANAMSLATADVNGKPSVRTVLLKGFDENGFRFFTNYQSRKGHELEVNKQAALCFYWPNLERQVRIEGTVQKLSRADSEAYFQKRPRESQLGAWASDQSRRVESRKELDQRFQEMRKKFEGIEIPAPDYWGGFSLEPTAVEFWQGRKSRMHDRLLYKQEEEGWIIRRLAP